jgi:DNA-nicking Smr family endonuclease
MPAVGRGTSELEKLSTERDDGRSPKSYTLVFLVPEVSVSRGKKDGFHRPFEKLAETLGRFQGLEGRGGDSLEGAERGRDRGRPDPRPSDAVEVAAKSAQFRPARAITEDRERGDRPVSEHEVSSDGRVLERPIEDNALFLNEIGDVRQLPRREAYVARRRRNVGPVRPRPDEALAELDDLVSGRRPFEFSSSDEHVEGIARGVDRRLLRRLKRGEFSVSAHIDLHGRTRAEAKPIVERFLQECRKRNRRCVLIVHGRGHHSKDQIPVLKESLRSWLEQGSIGRVVLAFCSARPTDGGLGAVYVLLRRASGGERTSGT